MSQNIWKNNKIYRAERGGGYDCLVRQWRNAPALLLIMFTKHWSVVFRLHVFPYFYIFLNLALQLQNYTHVNEL